jgi:hypothetical protein
MRRKKLLAVALILILAVAAFLFLDTTTRGPLDMRITGMTNQEQGGVNIYFSVSNRTPRNYCFFTYPQTLSNGVWFASVDDHAPFGGVQGVRAHVHSEQIVYTFRNAGTMRLQLTAWPETKPWPKWMSGLLKQFHLQQFISEKTRREFDTPPFELPPR